MRTCKYSGQSKNFLMPMVMAIAVSLSPALVGPLQSAAAKDDDVILSEIAGRVLDSQRNPVVNAQVKLLNEKGDTILSTDSANDGSFSLKHGPCVLCTLQVVPDDKSALASALIENIPGDANRRFLVTLQHGFKVKGKITGNGKGLKGLIVKVVAAGDDPKHVHSGGEARTARDGTFVMNLTPGPKLLTIDNQKYLNFVSKYEHELHVVEDQQLSDINLPIAR